MNHSLGPANCCGIQFVHCPCLSVFLSDCSTWFLLSQFFQRTQMQPPRPTIPSNSPSIRPASQAPNATVYSPSPPIMMSMTPMPFASPQAAQYYIPQVSQIHQRWITLQLFLYWLKIWKTRNAKFMKCQVYTIPLRVVIKLPLATVTVEWWT